MSPKISRLMWGTLLGSCLIATFALSPSRAQNRVSVLPDKLVPLDTVLLVRWDGTAAHAKAFSETAAHEALYESGLVPLLEKAFQGIIDQAGPKGAMLDGPAGQALSHVKENGATVAVALAAPSPDGPPIALPYAVVVFPEGGQFAEPLGQMLQQMAGMKVESQEIDGREISSFLVPDAPGIEVGWWVEGEHLVVAAGMNALPTAIAVASGELPNITANPLWKEFGPESVDFEMTGLSWLDLGNIREAYGEMPVPIPMAGPDGQPFTVNQIAKVAGLDNVGAAVSQSGYKGKALWSETVLQVDGEKRGLLALSDHKPITLEQLPPLPADTMTFAAGSFSLSKFYTDLLSIVNDAAKLGPPEIGQQVQQGIEAAPQILGFDPKTDLFDTLGNVTALYLDSSQDFLGFGGVAAIMEVKDAEKLQKTLNHMLLMGEAAAGGEFTVVRSEKYGRQIISFEVEGVEFGGLTVDENWVILGLMPQTVEVALLRIDGKLDHFVPSRELQAALAGMPKEFTSIAVSNPRQTYKTLMGYAPLLFSAGKAGLRNSGMFPPDLEIPVALADIPPSEVVIRPLFPNVMVGESTAQGFRWTSRNSLPSLPFAGDVGGVGSVGTIGVLTALLLPAVQQAREAARRSQSKNNMKQIMLAMHNYHEVYRSFPAGTIEDSAEDPDDRLSWLVSILPFADQAPLYEQIDRKSAWDSDANSEWTSFDINTFLNPSNPNIGEGSTHYIGMAGIGEDAAELEVDHARAGVFGYDRKTRIRDIKDGTSNTIAITGASDDIGPWAKGGRSTFRGLTEEPYINGPDGIGGPHHGGMHAGFADGSVRFISENIDQDLFKKLITINGGEPVRGPF
jgi:type II secretory pathway pseudopilin PulG